MFLLALALLFGGCNSAPQATGDGTGSAPQHVTKEAPNPTPKTDFDGAKAYELLKKQVAFGYRVPGTPAHDKCLDWMEQTLKESTPNVHRQPFTGTYKGKKLLMTNLIARFNPDAKTQILLLTHWDTRPIADQDPIPENKKKPIPGANDGASGTAVFMELARSFGKRAPDVGVVLLFTDGEDVGPDIDNMLLGARYWAKNQIPRGVKYGILIDMIGDKDLRVPVEEHGYEVARDVVQRVYDTAKRLSLESTFPYEGGGFIEDDHIPLNEAGVKTIDLIDFTYPYWHTVEDTVDKCSAASLTKVGVLLEALLREEK
jgi:glutaminyl-peptide cyclotransferase